MFGLGFILGSMFSDDSKPIKGGGNPWIYIEAEIARIHYENNIVKSTKVISEETDNLSNEVKNGNDTDSN